MADYIFTQNGDGNVQIGADRLTGDFKGVSMFATVEQARQYNKLRQYEDTGLTPDEIAALRAENAAFKARWTETASDNTDYTLSHLDGIYTVCDPNGCVVCEFIRDAALSTDARMDGRAIRIIPRADKDYKIVLPGGIEAYDPERR